MSIILCSSLVVASYRSCDQSLRENKNRGSTVAERDGHFTRCAVCLEMVRHVAGNWHEIWPETQPSVFKCSTIIGGRLHCSLWRSVDLQSARRWKGWRRGGEERGERQRNKGLWGNERPCLESHGDRTQFYISVQTNNYIVGLVRNEGLLTSFY